MPRGRQVALFASALVAVKLNLDGGFEGAYALSTRERKEAVECGQKLKQAVGLGAAAAVMLMLTVAECAEYQGAHFCALSQLPAPLANALPGIS